MNIEVTWHTILEISAGLVLLFELGKWLISFGNPIVELKNRVNNHDNFLRRDKEHLEKVDKSIQQIDEGLSVVGLAIAEMISHEINGNDITKLKEQKEKVETYFYGRKSNED